MSSDELDERQRIVEETTTTRRGSFACRRRARLARSFAARGPLRRRLLGRDLLGRGLFGWGLGCALLRALLRGAAGALLLRRGLAPFVADGDAALRPADGHPGQEDPAHVGDGLAADQAALVEEPGVLAVELLKGVVAQDGGP